MRKNNEQRAAYQKTLSDISQFRNFKLTEQEIKLLNLVKLIVNGGWIIDVDIMREVIEMAGLKDIIKIKNEAQTMDLGKEENYTFFTVKTLCQNFGFKDMTRL